MTFDTHLTWKEKDVVLSGNWTHISLFKVYMCFMASKCSDRNSTTCDKVFWSQGSPSTNEWTSYLFHRFEEAISSQPIAVALCTDRVQLCGTLLIVFGTVLVLSSTWSLGIIGTFLGMVFSNFQAVFVQVCFIDVWVSNWLDLATRTAWNTIS